MCKDNRRTFFRKLAALPLLSVFMPYLPAKALEDPTDVIQMTKGWVKPINCREPGHFMCYTSDKAPNVKISASLPLGVSTSWLRQFNGQQFYYEIHHKRWPQTYAGMQFTVLDIEVK